MYGGMYCTVSRIKLNKMNLGCFLFKTLAERLHTPIQKSTHSYRAIDLKTKLNIRSNTSSVPKHQIPTLFKGVNRNGYIYLKRLSSKFDLKF